jgi:phage-related protein
MAVSMDKEVIWLHGEVKAPPFSEKAQDEAGFRLRRLQQGRMLTLPHSRPMPSIGPRCHELRIRDEDLYWRIIYRIDEEAILVVDVFPKKTETTPPSIISNCRKRLVNYDKE